MATVTVTRKVGSARRPTAARFWLEGKTLITAGWKPGQPFAVEAVAGNLILRKGKAAAREGARVRHVAGTAERPVIDVTGELVRDTLGAPGSALSVTIERDTITASRA